MAKKNKKEKNVTPREKHNEDVINELFGSPEEEPDIEGDIAELGSQPDDDVKIAHDPRKNRFFFGLAVFVVIMAGVGCVSTARFVSAGIRDIMDNTSLKNEFARFLLPVVANDIAPFENVEEVSNTAKISIAIWNILVNKDTAPYKTDETGNLSIPEYDVGLSCAEIFGSGVTIEHRTVGVGDTRFAYDEAKHVYACSGDMRYLNYSPRIVDMTENNGTYVLTVEYLPPSFTLVTGDLGFEVTADKTMEYTINRWDKKNTLMSVRFIDSERF
ncbi:MAG: hypothetical protein NC299_10305 [Lachnospiraceae bacterium]|nr:hypothetical protein [Ruminococcus sp.]MCM1275739.1 hypothetical protein [Lachnospiraceae bacterium]